MYRVYRKFATASPGDVEIISDGKVDYIKMTLTVRGIMQLAVVLVTVVHREQKNKTP